jgi:hypothetical protein
MLWMKRKKVFLTVVFVVAIVIAGLYFSFSRIERHLLSYLKKSVPSSVAGFDIVMEDPYVGLFPPSVSFVSLTGSRNEKKYLGIGGCKVTDIVKLLISSDRKLSLKCESGFVSGEIIAIFTSGEMVSRIKDLKVEKTEGSLPRTVGKVSFNVSIDDLLLEKNEMKEHFKVGFDLDGKDGIFRFSKTDRSLTTDSGELLFSLGSNKADLRIEDISIEPFRNFFPFFEIFNIDGKLSGIIGLEFKKDELLMESDISFSDISINNPIIDRVSFSLPFFRINGHSQYSIEKKEFRTEDMKVTIGGVDGILSGSISPFAQELHLIMDGASIVRLATVVNDDLFKGFNTGGMIDLGVYYYKEKESVPDIMITGRVEKPEQYSDRKDYLKSEFIYSKDLNSHRDVFIGPTNGYFVSFEELPEHLIWAVVTSEDAGFFRHHGVDFAEISAAAKDNVKRKKMRGGSTITQQIIKNLYLGKEQTLVRKFREMLLAIELDAALSKQRMLEIYFNIVEWAPNVFGIGEASIYFFGKAPWELSVLESVYLASVIPGPYLYHRYFLKNSISDKWIAGMHRTLDKLYEAQKITTEEYLEAMRGKIVFREIEREESKEE